MGVNTIVFDWGNTLMVNYPEFEGPMVSWPLVSAIPGAKETLETLKQTYCLVVASNANESDAGQVWSALARVGLDQSIHQVFTWHELGARKPEKEFFRAIEKLMGRSGDEMLMVGDSYPDDMVGAYQTGWKTTWYNPEIQAPPGLIPFHTSEIYSLTELPSAIKTNLPDWVTCYQWLMENSPSQRLWLHSQLVAAIAYIICFRIKLQGGKVSPLLAERGGLVHDLAKLKTIGKTAREKDHGLLGSEWLNAHRQYELSEISNRHMLHAILDPSRRPRTWEEKAVYFADKLAEGANLVGGLDERISALKKRYPDSIQKIDACLPELLNLQRELAEAMALPEERLIVYIRTMMNGQTD